MSLVKASHGYHIMYYHEVTLKWWEFRASLIRFWGEFGACLIIMSKVEDSHLSIFDTIAKEV